MRSPRQGMKSWSRLTALPSRRSSYLGESLHKDQQQHSLLRGAGFPFTNLRACIVAAGKPVRKETPNTRVRAAHLQPDF